MKVIEVRDAPARVPAEPNRFRVPWQFTINKPRILPSPIEDDISSLIARLLFLYLNEAEHDFTKVTKEDAQRAADVFNAAGGAFADVLKALLGYFYEKTPNSQHE